MLSHGIEFPHLAPPENKGAISPPSSRRPEGLCSGSCGNSKIVELQNADTAVPNTIPPPIKDDPDDDPVFDLAFAAVTDDSSDAIKSLKRAASKDSAKVVVRLKYDVELSAHDWWALQEPNADIESSVLDAWGLVLGRRFTVVKRLVECGVFSHIHNLVNGKKRKSSGAAAKELNKAIRSSIEEKEVCIKGCSFP